MLKRIISNIEADESLLGLANEKGKFAIELGLPLEQDYHAAFERGIDNEWFTLVDLCPVVESAFGRMMRVFRLTQAGRDRLVAVRAALSHS